MESGLGGLNAVPMTNTTSSLVIGGTEDGTWSFNGWLDEFRFSNGIARWTSNFTPPTSEYSSLAKAPQNHFSFVDYKLPVPQQQSTAQADTIGVFRSGLWFLKNKNETGNGFADVSFGFGVGGDYSVAGDWNGDGIVTHGVYRNGIFYLRNTNTTSELADISFAFGTGTAGDQPIAGDWDGDGIDTIGVYNSSTQAFLLRDSNSAGPADYGFSLGILGDIAIAGDWNNDGRDTVGVYHSSPVSEFYLKNTNEQGFADIVFAYGLSGDKPLAGDWNSDGVDTIGVFRVSDGYFYLRNSNTAGDADIQRFAFGYTTDIPVAGNWDGQPLTLPPTPTPSPTPNPGSPLNASFSYDGDGKRVTSTINVCIMDSDSSLLAPGLSEGSITLETPDFTSGCDVYLSPEEATRKIRMFAALGLYQAGEVSVGTASQLVGLDRYEFLEFCKREGVVLRTQTPEELEEDLRNFGARK